jgi:uncharacterized UBP type Zn finger protein
MREKFKKRSSININTTSKKRKSRGDATDMSDFMRKNSAVFDLEDSIFKKKEGQRDSIILNRKNSMIRQTSKEKQSKGNEYVSSEEGEGGKGQSKKVKKEALELTELIEMFFSEEYIEDYNCSNCKKKTIIKKFFRIVKFPEILVISLKRFEFYPRIRKIKKNVKIGSSNIDLRKYVHKNSNESNPITPVQVQSNVMNNEKPIFFVHKNLNPGDSDMEQNLYSLRGYIEHHGNMNKGHYIAFMKQMIDSEKEQWLLKNDDEVYVVENHENYLKVDNRTVYSLFYQTEKQRI